MRRIGVFVGVVAAGIIGCSGATAGSGSADGAATGGGGGADTGGATGGGDTGGATTGGGDTGGATTGGATDTWATKTKQEKQGIMGTNVVPTLGPLFKAFDAKFSGFGCKSCHPTGMLDGSFAMPDAGLAHLEASKLPYSKQTDAKLAAWGAFMESKVVPTMITALGTVPLDPTTGKGFGCKSCHVINP